MIVELDIRGADIQPGRIHKPASQADDISLALFVAPQETHIVKHGSLIAGILECPEGESEFLQGLMAAGYLRFEIPDEGDGPVRLLT